MVFEEVRRAYQRKRAGELRFVPVRLDYTGALPYDLSGYLSRIQYTTWEPVNRPEAVYEEIVTAIQSPEPAFRKHFPGFRRKRLHPRLRSVGASRLTPGLSVTGPRAPGPAGLLALHWMQGALAGTVSGQAAASAGSIEKNGETKDDGREPAIPTPLGRARGPAPTIRDSGGRQRRRTP